jgi:hypothetical protein
VGAVAEWPPTSPFQFNRSFYRFSPENAKSEEFLEISSFFLFGLDP